MALSVYRWTDGPYLAFTDRTERRYVLERDRAAALLERMDARLRAEPDRPIMLNRRFARDPQRDLTVNDMYVQDCDNHVEVITATGPILLVTLAESHMLLRLAIDRAWMDEDRQQRDMPSFLRESALPVMLDPEGLSGASQG